MSETVTKEQIIRKVFEALGDSGIAHCGVGLPVKLLSPHSRDVDLFVSREDLKRLAIVLADVHQSSGWSKIKEIKNEYSLQLFYYSDSHFEDAGGFVQWDLMPWSSWRGVPFVEASELTRQSVTEDGLSYLRSSFRKDYKALRSMLCKPSHPARSERDPENFSEWFCRKLYIQNISSVEEMSDRQIRRKFVVRSILRSPVRTVTGVASFLYYYLLRMISPPGMVLGAAFEIPKGNLDEEIKSLLSELPITRVRVVPILQWRKLSFRLKLLSKMFIGDVIVISEYEGAELSKDKKKWGISYLFSGKVDRVLPIESSNPEFHFHFREVIQKTLQNRIKR